MTLGNYGDGPARGFTLIELLIASIILAILLVGIGLFFVTILKQSDVVDDQTRAMELARQGLEEIRSKDIRSMSLGRTASEDLDKFTRYFVISEVDPLYPNARRVQCFVYWTGASGPDTLSFSTIF